MSIITTYPEIYEKSFVKSHYKLNCFCCGNTINVGDEITMTQENGGITLRPRVLKKENNCDIRLFYTPDTACRWVHKDCEVNFIWTLHKAFKVSSNIDFCNDNNYETDSETDYETDSETDSYDDLASCFASDSANENDFTPLNDGGDDGYDCVCDNNDSRNYSVYGDGGDVSIQQQYIFVDNDNYNILNNDYDANEANLEEEASEVDLEETREADLEEDEFYNTEYCFDDCGNSYYASTNGDSFYYDICDEYDEYDSNDENSLFAYNHYNKNH